MRHVILLAGALGGAVPVLAAAAVPPQFQDNVVVTASLRDEEADRLPVTVTVIEAAEIEALQATEALEVLATVAGVSVAQSGSPGHVTSLFTRGTDSNQTMVLWNGVPLDDPFFGGYDWAFLSTEGVERIEVARGPFSALHGSDAIGGVVQLVTRRGDGGRVRLEGGENGYGRAALSAGRDAGRLHLDVNAHARRGDGVLPNDSYDGDEIVVRTDWSLDGGGRVGVVARGNDSEIGIPLSSGVPTPRRTTTSESREIAVPIELAGDRWGFEALISSTRDELAFRDPDDFFFTSSDTRGERLRGRAVGSWSFGPDLWLAAGGEWERQQVDNASNFGVALDGARRDNQALFAQLHRTWGRLRVDLGVRRDDDEFFGGKTSPKLGAVVGVGEAVRVWASYGEGFRAPALGELFFPFFGNPDLRPERSRSVELGYGYRGSVWDLTVVGFESEQRDLIDSDPLTFLAVNRGRARSRGIEVAAGFRKGIVSGRINMTQLEAEDLDTDQALLRRPDESANLVLTVEPGPWSLNLTARHVGERPDLSPVTFGRAVNPGYTAVDLGARWRPTARLSPHARVENVADERYQEVLGFPAPGRSWVGGVTLRF